MTHSFPTRHSSALGAALGLELGYALIGLVDERKGAPLMTRITGIRRQLSRELGFVIPLVRVRDNLALGPNSYRITVAGVICAEDEIWPRSEEHTSELQSLMRISYAVICLQK